MSIATIILAAGGSTRLGGTPKQLLTHRGQTLLRHIVNAALALEVGPVIVVLGAHEDQMRAELTGLSALITTNTDWQEGMASSLRKGLLLLTDKSFLVVLTDQPYVTTDLLQQLINTRQQTGKGIVACRYGEAGNLGVPALFSARYKADFLQLSGDTGARKLIQHYADDCAELAFPLAEIDLDTWQDVENWQRDKNVGHKYSER